MEQEFSTDIKTTDGTSIANNGEQATGQEKSVSYLLAQGISILMHPFFMPFYAALVFFFGYTILAFMPVRTKLFFLITIFLGTLAIPVLFTGLLRAVGYLDSFSLSRRDERILPLAVCLLSYVICAIFIPDYYSGFLVKKMLLSGAACIVLAVTVTLFWKISLHMIVAGGILAIFIAINHAGYGSLTGPIVVLIILSGLLASARLYLGSHNPAQVLAGFLGGFIAAGAVIWFL